jgi:signal transduction histidine kinase
MKSKINNYIKHLENLMECREVNTLIQVACESINNILNGDTTIFYNYNKKKNLFIKKYNFEIKKFLLPEVLDLKYNLELERVINRATEFYEIQIAHNGKNFSPVLKISELKSEVISPLILSDKLYGIFFTIFEKRVSLKNKISLIKNICKIIKLQIENIHDFSKSYSARISTDILSATSYPIDQAPNYYDLYKNCFKIIERFDSEIVCSCIWLCTSDSYHYDKIVHRAVSVESLSPPRELQKKGLTEIDIGKVIKENKAIFWPRVEKIKNYHNPTAYKILSNNQLLALPFQKFGEKPFGLITIYLPETKKGIEKELQNYQACANLIGSLIAQAGLSEKTASIGAIFKTIISYIKENPDFTKIKKRELFRGLTVQFKEDINVGGISIYFKESSVSRRLHLFATSGLLKNTKYDDCFIELSDEGITARCVNTGETIAVDDLTKACQSGDCKMTFPEWVPSGFDDIYLCTPIFSGNDCVGVVRFRGKKNHVPNMVNFFNDVDIELAKLIGSFFTLLKNLIASEETVIFGSTMSGHDMRTTLGIALTASKMLYDKIPSKTEHIKYLFKNIEGSINLLTFLSRAPDVLHYWEPNYQKIGFMGDVIAPIIGMIKPICYVNEIEIYYDENFFDLPKLFIDRDRMQQLVWNLLINSIKYSCDKKDKDKIIKIEYAGTKDDVFIINFIDFGIGINKIDKNRIFEIGVRTDEAIEHVYEGQGKGLPSALIIAKKHGGDIEVTSFKNPTIFSLKLPVYLSGGPPNE